MAGQKIKPKPEGGGGLRILWRPKLLAALGGLAAIGFVGHLAWQRYEPVIARHPQFQITADRVRITPPPPWIRSDVKGEVLRDAGLLGSLSVLENGPALQQRVRDAFSFHPWVAGVKRITTGLPASLEVELDYRQPVAAVEAADAQSVSFLPIDVGGVRLPDADFNDMERRYLPRISGVTGRPVVGAPWSDPRVTSAAELAARLADVWNELRLVEIVPSQHPQVRGELRYYTFEIVTSGGTRIVWGAAPGQEQDAAESPFDAKRKRLLEFATKNGNLDSIDGPAAVDVRSDLVVTPRTARKPAGAKAETETK